MTALDPAALNPDPRDLVRRAALEIHAGGDAAPLLAEIASLPADHPDRRLAAAFGRGLEIRRSGENPDAGNLYAPTRRRCCGPTSGRRRAPARRGPGPDRRARAARGGAR